ncbi:MAG: DUF3194 domain-containing protein [Halodesulfurarchaeum sp.]
MADDERVEESAVEDATVEDAAVDDETVEDAAVDDETVKDATVDDETVVETAAEAAHGVIFSRLGKSTVEDLEVTVTFEEGVLEVEVSVFAPESDADLEQIADDAALAAQGAVDELFGTS